MWAKVQFQGSAAFQRALGAFGTLQMSFGLAVLLVVRAAATGFWSRLGTEEGAAEFATSWSAWLLAAVVVADGCVYVLRVLPAALPSWFPGLTPSAVPRARRAALGSLLLATAWLLVGVSAFASLAFKDRFTLWAGAGERFEGRPGQYLTRDRPRAMSPGPRPIAFTVEEVSPRLGALDRLESLDVRISIGAAARSTSLWRPLWLGGSRFLLASGYGYAPRFEVLDAQGRVVDTAFVKMDLLPPGRSDHIRSEVLPHRFYIRLAPPRPGRDVGMGFQVDVFREKLPVASGRLSLGEPLAFEGLTFRLPEVNYVARFVLVDDPGILVLLLAALTAVIGGALRGAGPREAR